MTKQPSIAQLKIAEFSKEGLGRGIWQKPNGSSYSVDVPFAIPGDEVEVQLLKRKGGIYRSRYLDLVHSADSRISPLCVHFGKCGGCRWQQITYEEQLRQKEAWIYRYLKPYINPSVVCHPIIPCLPPWRYRNKMELTFSNDKGGTRYLGLILFGTRGHVFQMEECHLAQEWVIDAVKAVSNWWKKSELKAYHAGSDVGSLRTLILREGIASGDRMVMLTVSGNPTHALNRSQIDEWINVCRQSLEPTMRAGSKLSLFLRIQQIAKGKKTQFFEMLLYGPDHIREEIHIESTDQKDYTLQFRISPSAFFQPNTRQAERLYSRAIELTEPSSDSVVYDLYCGTGTLGICLAKQVKEVIGIELSPESSLDARENAKENQIANISILTGDVGTILPTLLQGNHKRPTVVFVDPPRAGLDAKAIKHILDIKAPTLTYISCNPETQAANLASLIEGGYHLKTVQPVDQFPQTVHVENIVVLQHNS